MNGPSLNNRVRPRQAASPGEHGGWRGFPGSALARESPRWPRWVGFRRDGMFSAAFLAAAPENGASEGWGLIPLLAPLVLIAILLVWFQRSPLRHARTHREEQHADEHRRRRERRNQALERIARARENHPPDDPPSPS